MDEELNAQTMLVGLALKTIQIQAWLASRYLMNGDVAQAQEALTRLHETAQEGLSTLREEP